MKKVIGGIIALFVIMFIWHNSLQDAMHLEYASLAVVHLMQPLLATLGVRCLRECWMRCFERWLICRSLRC